MIARLHGTLIALEGARALVRCDHLVYEVLVPAADQPRLSQAIDEPIVLHTLHYLESQGQGSAFVPRLVGFASADDRAFFELFTTVRGMGSKKALRALTLPFGRIAQAIAERDLDVLKSLPEVGKKVAETIVLELQAKVDRFVEAKPEAGAARDPSRAALVHDVVTVLVQLGEQRLEARELVDRALAADPAIDGADQLIEAAYRLKQS